MRPVLNPLPSARRIVPILALAAFAAQTSAVPLDADFLVTDKLGKPISGVALCLQEDNTQCAETNPDGRATLAATVRTRPVLSAPEEIAVFLRRGRLTVTSPVFQPARIARFDAGGRSLGPDLVLDLKAGVNALDFPKGRAGLFFFRVTTAGRAFSGKGLAFADGGTRTERMNAAGASRIMALGKVATANLHAVVVSKTGYRSVVYRPKTDRDTGVVIRLPADGDSGIQYAGVIRAKVMALDTAKHTLDYAYLETRCTGDSQVTLEQHSSFPFYVRDNTWYFPAGKCQGVALGKDGEGWFGSWRTLGMRDLPPGLFPAACDPLKDSVVTGVLNLFFINEGGGWDIDLRADSMAIRIRRELCPGNQAVNDIAAYDGKNGHPLLAKNTCREVELRNPADEPGKYSFQTNGDSLRGVFTYKDKTCPTPGVSLSLETNAPKTCPEPRSATLASDTTFQRCVHDTGFLPAPP